MSTSCIYQGVRFLTTSANYFRAQKLHLSQLRRTLVLRRTIVTQISPTTSLLRSDTSDNEVYLLGTAHISESSAKEVRQLAEVIKPQRIFIELDPPRAARLRASANESHQNEEDFIERMVKEALNNYGRGGMPLPSLPGMPGGGAGGPDMLKAAFQQFYKILKQYGYVPGIEMLAAMEEADRIGADIYYGDVDANDTLRELRMAFNPGLLLRSMTTPPPPELQDVMQDVFSGGGGGGEAMDNLGDRVEALKTREHARKMTQWMEQSMPEIAEVMIHRRDRTMAENLRKHCADGKVLAVVGLAHVDGIESEWQKLGKSPSMLPP